MDGNRRERGHDRHCGDALSGFSQDKGFKFSLLYGLEDLSKTLIYFVHPHTSCEKGSVERHNSLIRRFIPKGKRIDSYSDDQLAQIETRCNCLPRKPLGYRTPDDLFEDELDRIHSCVA